MRNIFLDGASGGADTSVKALQAKGTFFWQCNVALGGVAQELAQVAQTPVQDVRAELIAGLGGEHIVEFALTNGGDFPKSELAALPAVKEVRTDGNGIALNVTELHVAIPALLRHLQSRDLDLARLSTRQASLEDVFVSLTGRHLRDDELSSS